jgi:hypothetical protein
MVVLPPEVLEPVALPDFDLRPLVVGDGALLPLPEVGAEPDVAAAPDLEGPDVEEDIGVAGANDEMDSLFTRPSNGGHGQADVKEERRTRREQMNRARRFCIAMS